jgi:dethiobiotin synthetase
MWIPEPPIAGFNPLRLADDLPVTGALRVVLVGTGTGVGKTHVACALLGCWSGRVRVVGLKPIETGVVAGGHGRRFRGDESDQERLAVAARLFHVKRLFHGRRPIESGDASVGTGSPGAPSSDRPPPRGSEHARRAPPAYASHVVSSGAHTDGVRAKGNPPGRRPEQSPTGGAFHVKHQPPSSTRKGRTGETWGADDNFQPRESLLAFPEPISPHVAARNAGLRIDFGLIDRWVQSYEAPITVIETAGGFFSPLGYRTTNFDLTRALKPHVVLLVAPDRLGVLHDLTTTLAVAAARGGPHVGVVLSTPASTDASTGRNAAEIQALGIASPIAAFPRAATGAATTVDAAHLVIAWIERFAGKVTNLGNPPPKLAKL